MTIMTITLDDATELVEQGWFAFISQRPIPLGIRNINLGDARDAGGLFNQVGEPVRRFYGLNPIAPEGTAVKNELVSDRGLGDLYGIWKDLGITDEDIADSKLKFGDRGL